jgi:tRNA nucleotidyltransferase (CCA-adding enzyme)
MKIKLPEIVRKVLKTLEEEGFESYVVGGAVRDLLSGKEIKDWDFTTKAKPNEITKLFKDSFYDNDFGTVGVAEKHLGGKGEGVLEITTFRTESSYSDNRRPDKVEWGESLREDLTRRDFTINSMAIELKKGDEAKIIDPFKGQIDLKNKLIRAVGKPDQRFKEDALRMMRAIRMAAQLGFTIETKTLEAIVKNAELLKKIAMERVRDEFLKIVMAEYSKDGVTLLFTSGLLDYILPELIKTRGIEQAGHHTKDVWNHSLDAMANSPSKDPIIRMATLLHDVGKPRSKMDRGVGKEITFYNHEVIGARMVKEIARRFKMSKKEIDLLWLLVRWHMFAYEPKMTDKAIRRFIKRVGIENIDKMIELRVGDRIGGGSKATSWRLEELQQRVKEVLQTPMQIKDLKVTGHDVMKLKKIKGGPMVGKILETLFDEVMEDSQKNDREYLLKRIEEIK